jgi:histidyl-tRNA synthetase
MAVQKPSIPKGTRDFTPGEMIRRNWIFDVIRKTFEVFGYQPIETPAMENLSTLLGKYGEEGDKLLFRILNSGDFLSELNQSGTIPANSKDVAPLISEKGLRYDLTVPFARFVVQHQNELTFPFKRYQIQPVWRADRPQKGRYREFFQCDVDVIGSVSLFNEVELVQIIDMVFSELKVPVKIVLNNRKILSGIAEVIGAGEKLTDITMAMDKLDKIGIDKVAEELRERGLTNEAIDKLMPVIRLEGTICDKTEFLNSLFNKNETGKKGLEEISFLVDYLKGISLNNKYDFDIRLARGLNYYTGTIIEVKATGGSVGSVCGGGRYDDLTGIFGLPGVSGVGVSFGADRIYDVMNESGLFPEVLQSTTKILFINFGTEEEKYCMPIVSSLRASGVASEFYPENVKVKKQMEYANKKNIPYVALVGKEEMEAGRIKLKDMISGEQKDVEAGELKEILQKK